MKVWVCRDEDGFYEFFKKEAEPYLSGMEGLRQWYDRGRDSTFMFELKPELFKEYGGIKHLKKGTRRLIEWNYPLEGKEKEGENNLIQFAKQELALIGYKMDETEEGPNKWIVENLFELLNVFEKQGHTGSSAPYCINMFAKLAAFEPLSPITGKDDEWNECSKGTYQNRRSSAVFKQGKKGKPYYLDAIVWRTQTGSAFTGTVEGERSRQFIKLPFVPKTFYVDVEQYQVDEDDWEYTIKDRDQLIPVFEYYKKGKE
jgi:hypothetical protein